MWEADENDLAAAGAQLRHGRGCVLETLFDGLAHSLTENFPRHIARRWRRSEKREPDLLIRVCNSLPGRAHFSIMRARRSRSTVWKSGGSVRGTSAPGRLGI